MSLILISANVSWSELSLSLSPLLSESDLDDEEEEDDDGGDGAEAGLRAGADITIGGV